MNFGCFPCCFKNFGQIQIGKKGMVSLCNRNANKLNKAIFKSIQVIWDELVVTGVLSRILLFEILNLQKL